MLCLQSKKLILGLWLVIILIFSPLKIAATEIVELPNPLQCDDLLCVLFGVMRILLGILALLGTFMFIYGGFLMLTSGGNPEIIKKAKDSLVWSAIGIVVVLLSWAATSFIIKLITQTTL